LSRNSYYMISGKWSNILNRNLELQISGTCVIRTRRFHWKRIYEGPNTRKGPECGFVQLLFLKSYNYGEFKIEKPVKRHLGLFQLG